ncbi:MAG TPA: hypothetical protein DCG49_01310 [Ruminococcus sp.]|nr:hypothetical protein [Ruminococcus sp.]
MFCEKNRTLQQISGSDAALTVKFVRDIIIVRKDRSAMTGLFTAFVDKPFLLPERKDIFSESCQKMNFPADCME